VRCPESLEPESFSNPKGEHKSKDSGQDPQLGRSKGRAQVLF